MPCTAWHRAYDRPVSQVSRDRGINPVFIYGFLAGIVYALHDVGFFAGTFAEQIRVIGMQPTVPWWR